MQFAIDRGYEDDVEEFKIIVVGEGPTIADDIDMGSEVLAGGRAEIWRAPLPPRRSLRIRSR